MSIWLAIVLVGILTFLTRLSFIVLLERVKLSAAFKRMLRFVPIAVLSAIVAQELFFINGRLALSYTNPRLLAGLFATVVAYFSKSIVWTIASGMAVFWILQLFFA